MISHSLKLFSCFLLSFYSTLVHAEPKYPADISYMICDFKYSQEHGVKICEVQHGALSGLTGDLNISGGNGVISLRIANFFDQFSMKKWVTGQVYYPVKESLVANGWEYQPSFETLLKNKTFLKCAASPPADPSSIASYAGIVYATRDVVRDFNYYQNAYPGVLFMDAAILPYWTDKYKMNVLFNTNAELKEYKADWELYPKKYDPWLAERIQEKMPSELYVIKPRREFLGNGVIVVAKEDLDDVLRMILEPKAGLKKNTDKHYSFWSTNREETFLIEKYYRSDYIQFSQKLGEEADASALDNGEIYHYDPTMRIVFILEYDRGIMTYHFLGGYWKFPQKPLEEEGTLNEKTINFHSGSHYRAVDPELLNEINAELERGMLLLYDVMLNAA